MCMAGYRQIYYGVFESDESVTFSFGMPFNSMHAVVSPSLNWGASVLGELTQEFYAYFEAPSVEEMKFSPIGASMYVTFDKPVDYESLRSCGDIFASVSLLGAGAFSCILFPHGLLFFTTKFYSQPSRKTFVSYQQSYKETTNIKKQNCTHPESFGLLLLLTTSYDYF